MELWLCNNIMRLFSCLSVAASHTARVHCFSFIYYFLEHVTFDFFYHLPQKMSETVVKRNEFVHSRE